MAAIEVLKTAGTVLVIDWPHREVPETLARAGLRVVVRGGPGLKDPRGCWLPDEERRQAGVMVRSAGLDHLTEPYIAGVARQIELSA